MLESNLSAATGFVRRWAGQGGPPDPLHLCRKQCGKLRGSGQRPDRRSPDYTIKPFLCRIEIESPCSEAITMRYESWTIRSRIASAMVLSPIF